MTTTQIQPCESCNGTTGNEEDDLYQRARPGSKAQAGGWRFERLCADCRPDVTTTGGGPWETPPEKPPSGKKKGRGFR